MKSYTMICRANMSKIHLFTEVEVKIMKKTIKNKSSNAIVNIAYIFELIVSVLLIAAICVNLLPVISIIIGDYADLGKGTDFSIILEKIFSVIIGIEFLKMLCRHNIDSVVEVILFTLARKMILEHGTAFDSLLTIISIAILFCIRKYLFVKQLDRCVEVDEEEIANNKS